MSYTVVYTTRSNLSLQQAALWWAEHHDPLQAQQWLIEFTSAIESLGENPQRFAVACENEFFEITLRELHFGLGTKTTHRAVYEVREDKVIIHAIRHIAQRALTPDDI